MNCSVWRHLGLLLWSVWLLSTASAVPNTLRFRDIGRDRGLSQLGVTCLLQDHQGYLWVGTEDGLNRFDGNRFSVYRHDPDDPRSLSSTFVSQIFEDSRNTLWIVSARAGLNRYERETDRFTIFAHDPDNEETLRNPQVRSVLEDREGNFWVATSGPHLHLMDRERGTFTEVPLMMPDGEQPPPVIIRTMAEDQQGMIWLGGTGGLMRLSPKTRKLTVFQNQPDNPSSLSNNVVYALGFDGQGRLWVGTANGLNRLNDDGTSFTVYRNDPQKPHSLSFNVVRTFLLDDLGRFWIGTEDGLDQYHPEQDHFSAYHHNVADPGGLSSDNIWDLEQDQAGNFWVGTMGGGVNRHAPNLQKFQHIRHILGDPNSLQHPNIWSMAESDDGTIWISVEGGGIDIYDPAADTMRHLKPGQGNPHGLNNFRKTKLLPHNRQMWLASAGGGVQVMDVSTQKVVKTYRHDPNDPRSLGADLTITTYKDADDNLWITTFGGGLSRHLPNSDTFVNYRKVPDDPQSLSHDNISTVAEKEPGRLWVGTLGGGLNLLETDTGKVQRIETDPKHPNTLRGEVVFSLMQEKDGYLWVGTMQGGLNRYDPETDQWLSRRAKHGLPNDTIYGILPGEPGTIWVSTNTGLSKIDTETLTFRNYFMHDGIQGNEFNMNAYLRDRRGFLYFGGINGVSRFRPEHIQTSDFQPRTVFTQLLIANQATLLQNETFGFPVGAALQSAQSVTLDHTRNMFTLEFSALDVTIPETIRYRYKLEGYNNNWLETDALNRRATYTNLPAGTFTLRAKATNADGVWSDHEAVLQLVIKPPPWLSPWAKTLYVLILVSMVAVYLRIQAQKLAREQQIAEQQRQIASHAEEMADNERKVANRLRQVDKLKDEFLANTSHELRTPLNGMIGLAENLQENLDGALNEPALVDLGLIVSSGKRLSHLINDILNFSLLKKGQIVIHASAVDLHALARVVLALARPLVGKKNVRLVNQVPQDLPPVLADENRLEQVLHNLVGNAVKFTHRGHVQVGAEVKDNQVIISVADTGIGIAPEKHDAVFQMFQQADGSTTREYGGAGLGLAVTRELLKLQHGDIYLESELGTGSTFYVTLPIAEFKEKTEEEGTDTPLLPDALSEDEEEEGYDGVLPKVALNGYRILIVDDDPVNRRVLSNHLVVNGYTIEEAGDGFEALNLIKKEQPFDMVLLDVMMPRMTGYEVCRELRSRFSLDDLPIIFLTARSQDQDLVNGYETGANDFLVKPVAKNELLARVKTHLALLDAHRGLENKVAERTRGLVAAQEELLEAAHQAGMSEMATDVLHNVGNRLNSLNTAVHLIGEMVGKNRGLELLEKIGELLQENQKDLPAFFSNDPRAASVTSAIQKIAKGLAQRDQSIFNDGSQILEHVNETRKILSEQSKYAEVRGHTRPTDPNVLISEALQIGLVSFEERNIQVTTNQEAGLPQVLLNKARFMRVLLCLLRNAEEAVTTEEQKGQGRITVSSTAVDGEVKITVEDNGVGIEAGNLVRIFAYGVSTKDGRSGFGLHYCANVVNEMSGKIDVKSEGLGKGTLVTIRFPKAPETGPNAENPS